MMGSIGKYKKDHDGFCAIEGLVLRYKRRSLSACAVDVRITGFEFGAVMEGSEDGVGEESRPNR